MVVSISKANGEQYYRSMCYYGEGGNISGTWWGTGAKQLGLRGSVQVKDFKALWKGTSPDTNEKLVQNANQPGRRHGWDITFNLNKDLSMLWAFGNEDTRQTIEAIQRESVEDALSYAESRVAYCRRGDGASATRERVGLSAALFDHALNREGEMHFHTHALVMNVGTRSDGTTGTIESHPLYEAKLTMGAIYHAGVATRVEQRLGLTIERHEKKGLFRVAEVPKGEVYFWSQRSQQIDNYLQQYNLNNTPQNRNKGADTTRKSKNEKPLSEKFDEWETQGRANGFAQAEVKKIIEAGRKHRRARENYDLDGALQEAQANVMKGKSSFTEKDFIYELAKASIGRGLTYSEIRQEADRYLSNRLEVLPLRQVGQDYHYTTMKHFVLEGELLGTVHTLRDRQGHGVIRGDIEQAIRSRPTISEEQMKALRHVTTEGDVKAVCGMAGTGKTFFLEAAREIWQHNGYEVLGLALSGKAASGLQESAKIESRTIDSLFTRLDHERKIFSWSRIKKGVLLEPLTRKPLLTSNTVVVVDEAGMVDTAKMHRLLHEVEQAKAKIVLVGDAGQLQAIQSGGAFQAIVNRVGAVELTEIRRQRYQWAQDAVHAFREGRARNGLTAYHEQGLLHVDKTKDALYNRLITDWKNSGGTEKPHQHLIQASTNREVSILNEKAQRMRQEAGYLGSRHVTISNHRIYEGDRILFGKNTSEFQVKNGEFAMVKCIDWLRNRLITQLDSGTKRIINFKDYQDVSLGYAVTTHRSQGATVEHSYVIPGGSMQDRELSYVQMSRARERTSIYAVAASEQEAIDRLAEPMSRSRRKHLAIDTLLSRSRDQQEKSNSLSLSL